jgi:type II secretory pathway component PulF
MSHTDLSRLYRQFATIINAGVDYQKLMSSARARTPKQKRLFAHLNQEIKKQKPLSKVFNIPSVFPEWQIEWIKVGERTGRLNEVFSELSKEEERQSIRQKNLTTILA